MQTLEYRNVDKSTWGPGAWQDEPDKKQWTDPETGLPCLIVRNRIGALCGYVGVAGGHPYFGRDSYGLDIDVQGGLTFDGFCQEGAETDGICHLVEPGENDRVWWLGFDCAHSGDVWPKEGLRFADSIYRDLAYVTAQVTSLAAQLDRVGKRPSARQVFELGTQDVRR